jgi:2-polyprenyl-3-methyl-5-hydroxy-6-metoxy-1,4-benzoquinol methylase
VCAAPDAELVPGYETLRRVTSDCKPWPKGGRLCVCRACGCAQKVCDQAWRAEIKQIYDAYTIYHQSEGGAEQTVFESGSGQGSLRSVRLLESLKAHVGLPAKGRALDVGCGNGVFLRALSQFAPGWALAGTELSDQHREAVRRIEGVEDLYACPPDQVPGRFDLITMVHVLEHVPEPRDILGRLRNKLTPGGLLVVEIPNYLQNPFDLLVADHSTHFTPATVRALVESVGYEAVAVATDWVPKELTVVARRAEGPVVSSPGADGAGQRSLAQGVDWIRSVVEAAHRCAAASDFGLFGTSVAATWLGSELGDRVRYFVDEDPSRVGKTFMGRPVHAPSQVPPGGQVFLVLARGLAEAVERRLARPGVTYHLPPSR